MTATIETTRRIPRTANAAGVVKSWTVEPGTVVETGQELGIFDRDDLGEEQVTAPCSGVVGKGVAVGARVEAGGRLVYVEPTTTAPEGLYEFEVQRDAPQRRAAHGQRGTARGPSAQASASKAEPYLTTADVATSEQTLIDAEASNRMRSYTPASGRRGAHVEELTIEPSKSIKRVRPRRPKIVKLTCHPTDEQKQRLDQLMDRLSRSGHDYSFSELQRCAFEWLLGLSEQELLQVAEANRDKEQVGLFGFGKRPVL